MQQALFELPEGNLLMFELPFKNGPARACTIQDIPSLAILLWNVLRHTC